MAHNPEGIQTMSSRTLKKILLASTLSLGLTGAMVQIAPALAQDQPAAGAQAGAAKAVELSEDQKAVLAVSDAFDKAFDKADIPGLLAILADDIRIVDEAGEVYEGKDAVKDLYSAGFEKQPGATLETVVDTIRLITPEVALEDGTSVFNPVDGDPITTTYQAVYVKKDGAWKLSQLRDYKSPVAQDSGVHSEYLAALAWLQGDWILEGPDGVVNVSANWVDEGNAIEVKFNRKETTLVKGLASMRIGYDPRGRRIKSWTFDAAGGHGSSTWARVADQNSWLLKNDAVLPDGKVVSASQLLTLDESGDKIIWTTFDRAIDGVVTPSREEVTLTRQAPAPKAAALKPASQPAAQPAAQPAP